MAEWVTTLQAAKFAGYQVEHARELACEFVILVLRHIFCLSPELADHVTWQAHTRGVAPVCTRPKPEAERLIAEAHAAARASGYPLTFSMEPK